MKLPTWEEAKEACKETPTTLERFIYEYEPSNELNPSLTNEDEIFRERLAKAIEEEIKNSLQEACNLLKSSVKWLDRLDQRRELIGNGFFEPDCDPKNTIQQIREYLQNT